jgi:adenine/guanine phosphoribosyltransferase-like PRPP-binding protein
MAAGLSRFRDRSCLGQERGPDLLMRLPSKEDPSVRAHPVYQTAGYIEAAFHPKFSELLMKLAIQAKEKFAPFEVVVGMGMSGALVVREFADFTDASAGILRKPQDDSHAVCLSPPYLFEGPASVRSYVIIDDLVCSGETLRAIQERMKKAFPDSVCVGIVLWNESVYSSRRVPRDTPRISAKASKLLSEEDPFEDTSYP